MKNILRWFLLSVVVCSSAQAASEYGVRIQCRMEESAGKVAEKIRVSCGAGKIYYLDERGIKKNVVQSLDGKSLDSASAVRGSTADFTVDFTKLHVCAEGDCAYQNYNLKSPCKISGLSTVSAEAFSCEAEKKKLGEGTKSITSGFCKMKLNCSDYSVEEGKTFGQVIVCRRPENVTGHDQYSCPSVVECMRDQTFDVRLHDRDDMVKNLDYLPRQGSGVLVFNKGKKFGICVTGDTADLTTDEGKCGKRPPAGRKIASRADIGSDLGLGDCITEFREPKSHTGYYNIPTASYLEQPGVNSAGQLIRK